MRTASLMLILLAITWSSHAQETNSPPAGASQSLLTDTLTPLQQIPALVKEWKPNEIVAGKLVYSGIAVEVLKSRNPLQLLNPAAPSSYGSGEANVVRNTATGKPAGLKFLAIHF